MDEAFVLVSAGTENAAANTDNITFTIKYTNFCVPVVNLSAKRQKELKKLPRKGFQILVYWSEYKTNSEIRDTPKEYRHFFKWNFVRVKRFYV